MEFLDQTRRFPWIRPEREPEGITADAGSNPPNWLAIFCSAYESFVQDTVVAAVG
jgi:hypothetical protein